eukprot:SM000099S25189  [mRNA]  locus=s99:35483:36029:+ [translate_table: standard]
MSLPKFVHNAGSIVTLATIAIDGAIASLVKDAGSLSITEGAATIGAGTTARRVGRLVAVSLAYALTAKAASCQVMLSGLDAVFKPVTWQGVPSRRKVSVHLPFLYCLTQG